MTRQTLYLLTTLSLLLSGPLRAQQTVIHEYLQRAALSALLYTGKEDMRYPGMKGHPYMDTEQYREGTLLFDGRLYPGVLMRLNTHTDELVLASPDRRYAVALPSDRIGYARLPEYTLLYRHEADKDSLRQGLALPAGIYACLYEGACQVYKREVRYRNREIKDMQAEWIFTLQTRFYIFKDGIYHPVSSKSSVLKLFKDKKKELNQFIRLQALDFRDDKAHAIATLAAHYESLSPTQP
jgi:hypothetical protein